MGEETGRLGAGAFKEWLERRSIVLEQLMVAEPTLCKAIYGHKGHVRLKFILEGTPCHSSQPEHGKNAIVAAAKLVLLLDEEHQRLQAAEPNGLGPATLTTTLIEGGSGINIVPGEASISIDRRVVAGESSEEEAAKLIAMVEQFAADCPQCIAVETVPGMLSYEKGDAFLSDKEDTWIADLSKWSGACRRVYSAACFALVCSSLHTSVSSNYPPPPPFRHPPACTPIQARSLRQRRTGQTLDSRTEILTRLWLCSAPGPLASDNSVAHCAPPVYL